MSSIIIEYLKEHAAYTKKINVEKLLVLMNVGSFYEAYSTNEEGPNLHEISELINIVCTRRDKSCREINLKNPYLLGFPVVASSKFFKLLVDNGYTLVIIDQITSSSQKPQRKVTNIISSGTFVDNISNYNYNYIACVYIENVVLNNSLLTIAGMAAIDVSSGKCYVHEALPRTADKNFSMDEIARFVSSLNPKELIIHNTSKNISREILENYIDTDNLIFHYKNEINKNYYKLSFQTETLRAIYPNVKTMVSLIEYLELEKYHFGTISLIAMFDFINCRNENLLKNIHKPEFVLGSKHLILGNNAIYQLNVLNNDIQTKGTKTKYKSLLDVVNIASTPMGKRFVKDRLVSPLICANALREIYDNASKFICNDMWKNFIPVLSTIQDIERLYHKISMKIIHPYEFYDFFKSLEGIRDLNALLKQKEFNTLLLHDKIHNDLIVMLEKIDNIFLQESLKQYTLNDIKSTIFKKGIFLDVDTVNDNLMLNKIFYEKLCKYLSSLIDDRSKFSRRSTDSQIDKAMIEKYCCDNNIKNKLSIKKNDRDGYFYITTKPRSEMLKNKLKDIKDILIDNITISAKNIVFEENKKNVKISLPPNNADNNNATNELLPDLLKTKFIEIVTSIQSDISSIIDSLTNLVSTIDYYVTIAKLAVMYGYTKPKVVTNENSFIKCANLRHPIVERIIDYEYVPHNINIGEELKGMLIFGINSSGKSILMKAVGLSIILAQAGFFVPASEYEFSPYKAIYTRITGNDNLFRGMSSFVTEMMELNIIHKRADKNTLIIGDEICRGTEQLSGNAIVAATIIKLSNSNASFIFATHLHDIVKIDKVKELTRVKPFHLSVNYDAKEDTLVYDRVLREGSGEDVYGITVAKNIIDDADFISLTETIKKDIQNKPKGIILDKTSRYNAGIYMNKCQLCGKENTMQGEELVTHHINFQKNCTGGLVKNKPHIKKNSVQNLLVICKNCHQQIHDNKINIGGYIMTSKGKQILSDN